MRGRFFSYAPITRRAFPNTLKLYRQRLEQVMGRSRGRLTCRRTVQYLKSVGSDLSTPQAKITGGAGGTCSSSDCQDAVIYLSDFGVAQRAAGLRSVFLSNQNLIRRFLSARGVADPDDAVQELWITLTMASTDPISDQLGYIMRCAHHLAIDRRRAEARASLG